MRHGFIREPQDIKHLILYAMKFLPFAVAEKNLLEMVLIDDAFGYFEFAEAFSQLVEDKFVGMVEYDGAKHYVLTPRGQEIIAAMYRQLPVTVRERAEEAALATITRIRREDSIRTACVQHEDGTFTVRLSVCEKEREHLAIEMPALSQPQCTVMEKNFREKAETIYSTLIHLLSGDH